MAHKTRIEQKASNKLCEKHGQPIDHALYCNWLPEKERTHAYGCAECTADREEFKKNMFKVYPSPAK